MRRAERSLKGVSGFLRKERDMAILGGEWEHSILRDCVSLDYREGRMVEGAVVETEARSVGKELASVKARRMASMYDSLLFGEAECG